MFYKVVSETIYKEEGWVEKRRGNKGHKKEPSAWRLDNLKF